MATCRAFVIAVLFAHVGKVVALPFPEMPEVPIDRLIRNAEAAIKAHPEKPYQHYTLARIHTLAFTDDVKVMRGHEGRDGSAPLVPLGRLPTAIKDGAIADKRREHLSAALENYRKAIKIDPKDALSHLGRACLLQLGAASAVEWKLPPEGVDDPQAPRLTEDRKKQIQGWIDKMSGSDEATQREAEAGLIAAGGEAMPQVLERLDRIKPDQDVELNRRLVNVATAYWNEQAIASYLAAYRCSIDDDLKRPTIGRDRLKELVSYESGLAYCRMVERRGAKPRETQQLTQIKLALDKLSKKPPSPQFVTPIVFSFETQDRLDDLLAPNSKVRFDLEGLDRGQIWPWVKPTTGILVWDPRHTGKISSGRQLFGSVTFFTFWENGYQALDALDDNRDGELAGDELTGLAVWFDRNSDGVSDPGEVVPVDQLGIVGISARATAVDGIAPCNPAGIKLRNSRRIATYDWIVEPFGKTGSR